MNPIETILAIIAAGAGCTGLWETIRWAIDRRRGILRREDIDDAVEHALNNSSALTTLRDEIHQNTQRLERQEEWNERHEREMRSHKLVTLRQCLFAHPRDRVAHESALDSGREYIALGGNGAGHLRLRQLEDDYQHRLETDDWDYDNHRI